MNEERAARVVVWSKELLADPRTVVLDTETTGLGSEAEVVEVAVLRVDGEVLFDALMRPATARIDPGAARVHGLTEAMLAPYPPLGARWPELAPLLSRGRVVVYNERFDRRLLGQSVRANGLEIPRFLEQPWECAMRQYAEFRYAVGGSRYYRWQKLDDACRQMQVRLDVRAHRALADCQRTLALLRKMAAIG